jgi:hypothetical protein
VRLLAPHPGRTHRVAVYCIPNPPNPSASRRAKAVCRGNCISGRGKIPEFRFVQQYSRGSFEFGIGSGVKGKRCLLHRGFHSYWCSLSYRCWTPTPYALHGSLAAWKLNAPLLPDLGRTLGETMEWLGYNNTVL